MLLKQYRIGNILTTMKRKTTSRARPLPAKTSQIILTAEEDNRQILSVSDFTEFYRITPSYARKMISELVKAGWLVRAAKGQYQLLPARSGLKPFPISDKFVVACQAFIDSFIAFGSAAEYHGLSLQVFPTVMLANKSRSGERAIGKTKVRLVRLATKNYIGFQPLNRGPNVKVATIERTIIDCIHRPELAGGVSDLPEILRRGRSSAKVSQIIELLPTYKSKSLTQKVAYLLEVYGYDFTDQQKEKLHKFSAGVKSYLFSQQLPGTSKDANYSSTWGLIVNAPGFTEAVKA